ncbi:MAG: hypothetical protein WA996_19915 [Candidatus Promineifilaceae bacterium]
MSSFGDDKLGADTRGGATPTLIRTKLQRPTTGPDILPRPQLTEWLVKWTGTASLVITIVPFAKLAFLWFTGVIRDRLGDQEDRFFATVFLGGGIISVVMLFIWGAIIGAMFGAYTLATSLLVDHDIFIFGFAFMKEIIGNYALPWAACI